MPQNTKRPKRKTTVSKKVTNTLYIPIPSIYMYKTLPEKQSKIVKLFIVPIKKGMNYETFGLSILNDVILESWTIII